MSMREKFRFDVTDNKTGAQRFGITTNEVAEMCEISVLLQDNRRPEGRKISVGIED